MSANANIRDGRAYVEVTAETSKLKQNLNASTIAATMSAKLHGIVRPLCLSAPLCG